MSKYIPIDLGFEHYTKLKHHFYSSEYAKILAEMVKSRYVPVPAAEALSLYDADKLVLRDQVRVIWVHDVERPSDNYLAREMAEMEREFGFHSTYNIRLVNAMTPELRAELDAILAMGHEIQYQYEDLVIAEGDVAKARQGFKEHLAWLRSFYPDITVAFSHGVFKSGIDSTNTFKENGVWHPEIWQESGIHRCGELYYFMDVLRKELGDKFHYFGESRCIGGDEFAAALRSAKAGDVVFFLQHPTWWSDTYDIDALKYLERESPFFK